MGILSKPKAPAAQDPMAGAQAAQGLSQGNAKWSANEYMGTAGKGGPFGSIQYGPNGQTQTFSPGLQSAFDNVTGAMGQQSAGLPTGINFDPMTAQNIAQGNYDAYSAMTAPQRAQQLNSINTMMSERGIPLGDKIDNDTRGNFYNSAFLQDQNAAANAWNAVPGMQAQMSNTAIQQAMAPGNLLMQGVGIEQGGLGLLPGYNAPAQYNSADPASTYNSINSANMTNAQRQYEMDSKGYGDMWKNLIAVGAAPFTGGASLGLMSGMGSMFNPNNKFGTAG